MEYANNGMMLDWDSAIEKDSPFTLLPEGMYPFEIVSFERAYHPGSANLPACPKAVLTVKIDGGALGSTIVERNLFLHSKVEGLLCAFFTAIGQRKHNERIQMDWGKVVGATGWCKVYVEEYIKKSGEPGKSNRIERFIAPEEAPVKAAPEAPAMRRWTPGQ